MSSQPEQGIPLPAGARAKTGSLTALFFGHGRRAHFGRVAVVGLAAGLLSVAFQAALHACESLRSRAFGVAERSGIWGYLLPPVVGFLGAAFAGYLVQRYEPRASGSGIPHIKGVLLHQRTLRWWKLLPVKFLGGVVGIGSGLSLGREGPSVQMGAAVGQAVGNRFRVDSRASRSIIAAGGGAGLAAAFNAPLSGFLFVLEELRREFSPLTYGGAFIAAIAADFVARSFTGQLPSFSVHGAPILPLSVLPAVILLGVAGGLLGSQWNRGLLRASRYAYERKRVPRWLQAGIAGMLCGIVACWIPDATGGGHTTASKVLGGQFAQTASSWLLLLLGVKIVLTLVSYASGAPGGIFAPMLLQGALLGLLVGRLAGYAVPALRFDESTFAILGMAAWFGGSVRAPLTGTVLMLEMTGSFDHLFALALVSLTAYLVAERLGGLPVYDALLDEDLRRKKPDTLDLARPVPYVLAVQSASPLDGRLLREAGMPAGCLVVAIERAGRDLMPVPGLAFEAGDLVTILLPESRPDLVKAISTLSQAA